MAPTATAVGAPGPALAGPRLDRLAQCGRCGLLKSGVTSPVRSPAEVSNSLTTRQATSGSTAPTAVSVAAASQTRCGCGPGPERSTAAGAARASAISRR